MACQNQIQTSEQPQVSIPAEIIANILLRLSVKSLLRCRSVCKLWHSLISDPYFIHSKYLSSTSSSRTTNIKLIFINDFRRNITICNLNDALYDNSVSNKVLTVDTQLEVSCDRTAIAASCNGLVCFYDDADSKSMFILNPTTKIRKRLSPSHRICGIYGFGYDESSDDYKLLAICQFSDPRNRRYSSDTKLYSLKTGKWKTIGDFPDGWSMFRCDGKYSNGALHWVGKYETINARKIVSFHLATETYGQVLQPDYHDEYRFDMSLGALGEQLCMLCYYYERRSDIWVMKVYGVKESWTKLFCMPYMPDRGIIPRHRTPLFISNDGKILFEDRWELFVYDSKKGSYSEIQNFELYGRACTFVESLVSPMPASGLDNNGDNTFVESLVAPMPTPCLDNKNDDPWETLDPFCLSNLFD